MQFGLSFLPDTGPTNRSARDYYKNALRLSVDGEDLGMNFVKMTEHYLRPYGGYSPDPLTFLAAVAMRTERVRLMTGGIQASFHHPVQLAAHAAQVDAISDGRLEIGFARAFLPYEFETFGIDMDTSKERFRETVLATLALLSSPSASADTPFFRYDEVTSLPRPTQEPAPPIWVAALLTPESFEWAGAQGFSLLMASPPKRSELTKTKEMVQLYREAFEANHAKAGRSSRVAVSIPLMIAETDQKARERAEPLLRHHWSAFAEAARSWENTTSPAYAGYQEAVRKKLGGMSSDDLDATAILGSPETVRDKIEALRADVGIDVFLWHIDYGAQDYSSMRENIGAFASDVAPYLSASTPVA